MALVLGTPGCRQLHDVACRLDAVIQVVPVTGLPERPLRPYEAPVDPGESGLDRPSRLVANQIRTISRERIGEVIGRIRRTERAALDRALRIQLGL